MRDYRDILRAELERRTTANPLYSLRAMARDLGVAPSRLSEVLNARRGLSEAAAARMARRLGLTDLAREAFVASVAAQHARSAARRQLAAERLRELAKAAARQAEAGEPSYYIVAWYFEAVAAAARLAGRRATPAWLARRLGIREEQADTALHYLRRVGNRKRLRVQYDQVLDKARRAHRDAPGNEHDFAALTVALDAAAMPRLRRLIADFERDVRELAARSRPRDRDRLQMVALQSFRIDTPEAATEDST